MDYRELETLGLTEKEARVYLASLELGKSSVQNIAKRAEVNRATTYVVIEGLMKKGLMSSLNEDKKQYFIAESPEKLNLLFREQEQEIVRRKEYLKKIMPELRSLKSSKKDRPVVRYYEGKEGMISIIEEFYNTPQKEPFQIIYSEKFLRKIFSENEIQSFRKRRINRKIKVEVLVNPMNKELANISFSNRIGINEKDYPITSDIALFGDKTRLISLKNRIFGMIIEDKEITNTLRTIFKLARIGAKAVQKKKS